jgi:hypothetical protein
MHRLLNISEKLLDAVESLTSIVCSSSYFRWSGFLMLSRRDVSTAILLSLLGTLTVVLSSRRPLSEEMRYLKDSLLLWRR